MRRKMQVIGNWNGEEVVSLSEDVEGLVALGSIPADGIGTFAGMEGDRVLLDFGDPSYGKDGIQIFDAREVRELD